MPERFDEELTQWSTMLNTLTPNGYLPAAGSARRAMLDFITEQLDARVELAPAVLQPGDLFSPQEIEEYLRAARDAEPGAREHLGRRIIKAPEEVRLRIEASQVGERLAQRFGIGFRPDVEALFLFYREGHWVPLHLDDQLDYEFNLLTMLHRQRADSRSRTGTYFIAPKERSLAVDLEKGQSVFFHASYTPHGRTPVPEGEEVILLAIGLGRPGRASRPEVASRA